MSPNIEQLKNQLLQLSELARSGALSEPAYQETRTRLERQLLDAVLASPASAAPTSASSSVSSIPSRLGWGLAAFVLAFGAAGYAWLGHPEGLTVGPTSEAAAGAPQPAPSPDGAGPASAPHALGMDQIAAMTESLANKLKNNPNNPDGWSMLGRSYAVMGKWDEAISAYKKVIEQRPDDAQVYADMADALAVKQGRRLDGEPSKMVDKALSLDPSNFKALSLAGTIAFEKADYKQAAQHWEKALKTAPADNPDLARQIKASLDDARERAGLKPIDVASAGGAQVSGRVTVSASVASQASPDDTVFIFARPAQGAKMPLAILRKQVRDLPYTFTLTDAMAMSPQARLSGASDVVVGARISKSGQAMPQAGDLQGMSPPVKVGAKDIEIEIAEVLK